MCISMIGRIGAIDEDRLEATVDLDGRATSVSLVVLALESGIPSVGDWVMVHTGFAVEVLDEADARALLAPLAAVDPEQTGGFK